MEKKDEEEALNIGALSLTITRNVCFFQLNVENAWVFIIFSPYCPYENHSNLIINKIEKKLLK